MFCFYAFERKRNEVKSGMSELRRAYPILFVAAKRSSFQLYAREQDISCQNALVLLRYNCEYTKKERRQ